MNCNICPHKCNVNRDISTGKCKASNKIKINIWQLHFGEEPPITGENGSGTIFFSHCNLHCVFCQNYKISYHNSGEEYSPQQLADIMIYLQNQKAHNINLVTPSHYTIQIITAIKIAKQNGLSIPIIWNSNGYELTSSIKLLEGLIDIYMPDFKFFDDDNVSKYTSSNNYSYYAKQAIIEMFRQVGHLKINKQGIATKGLMIRHLIMPSNISSSDKILKWIADNIGHKTYISIMAQYYPTHKAFSFNEISRGINKNEYDNVITIVENLNFENGYIQDISSSSAYTPTFI